MTGAELMSIIGRLNDGIRKRVVGQAAVIDGLLIGLLGGGHILLEGLPGLGKTLLVTTVADLLALTAKRLQCTADLTPTDITGTPDAPGAVFTQMLLADEINRATPQAQSALLEAMQEGQVTVRGVTRRLPRPFMVLATQNPVEMEGTYPLPEAQLDRFLLKVYVDGPGVEDLRAILRLTAAPPAPLTPLVGEADVGRMQDLVRGVAMPESVEEYIVRRVVATNPDDASAPKKVRETVLFGVSPRGAQALLRAGQAHAAMRGRDAVTVEDIQSVAVMVLQHRLILTYGGLASGTRPSSVVEEVLAAVPSQGGLD